MKIGNIGERMSNWWRRWESTQPSSNAASTTRDTFTPSAPPPGMRIPAGEWRTLTTSEKQDLWNGFNGTTAPGAGTPAVPPGEKLINPALANYLAAHPELKTVQDLVNATYPHGQFESTCASLGLNPTDLLRYRTAYLVDYAYQRQPPPGTLPTTVEEANAYHLVEFNTTPYGTDYNRYYPLGHDFSNDCGPASLAMALLAQGKMPAGLNSEQEIEYARALITSPSDPFKAATSTVTVDGTKYPLRESNSTVGYGQVVDGAIAAGLPAEHTYGWGALNDALAAGHPVVLAGTISPAWKDLFPADGHYGSAGRVGHFVAILGKTADGQYIVNDPMYTGGAVAMTADQITTFTGANPDVTTVGWKQP